MKRNIGIGGDNQDNSWMGCVAIFVVVLCIAVAAGLCWLTS